MSKKTKTEGVYSILNNHIFYRVTTYLTQFLSKLSRNFVKNTFCNCFNTSQRGSLKYFKSMKLVLKIYLFFPDILHV